MPPNAEPTAEAALPAALVTLDNPSDAFEAAGAIVSFAACVALLAVAAAVLCDLRSARVEG